MNEIKCSVDYPELMQDTVLNLIEAEKCLHRIPQSSTLVLSAKTGIR